MNGFMKNSLIIFFFSREAPPTGVDRAADQPLGIPGCQADSGADLKSPAKRRRDWGAALRAGEAVLPGRSGLRGAHRGGGHPKRAGQSPGRGLCVGTPAGTRTHGELHAPGVTSEAPGPDPARRAWTPASWRAAVSLLRAPGGETGCAGAGGAAG